ncbi:LIM domain-containing protein [Methanobrevibacter woesei]|uniref:LIM domain-containing protein n=1 Tax=Methanobrevibacter woesei TaxID=190976 RepID=UPI0023527792|nr:LIM domain-containing protein [Methanobrevibacter woesei]
MDCHYHPEREAIDQCNICGKGLCEECAVKLAGKAYCKDCLENIIGVTPDTTTESSETQNNQVNEQSLEETPSSTDNYNINNSIYETKESNIYEFDGFNQENPVENSYEETDSIYSTDSINNIIPEQNYNTNEVNFPEAQEETYSTLQDNQRINDYRNQNMYELEQEEIDYQDVNKPMPEFEAYTGESEFIYPDHSYQPEETSARKALEEKYEQYLDDLYFDEPEVPLSEQLAKDEEKYGSIVDKPYVPSEPGTYDESYGEYEQEIITGEPYENYGTLDQQIHNENQMMKDEPYEPYQKETPQAPRLDPIKPQELNNNPQEHIQQEYNQGYTQQEQYPPQQEYTQMEYNQGYTQQEQYPPQQEYTQMEYNQGYTQEDLYVQPKPATKSIHEVETPVSRTPEETAILEEKIRQNISKEKERKPVKPSKKSIHERDYRINGKEPVSVVDIVLTIILIILILIVLFYLAYLFLLTDTYPTFLDAIYGLTDPQTFFSNLLGNI